MELTSSTAPAPALWSWVEWRADRTPTGLLALDEHDRRLDFGTFRDEGERVAAGLLASGIEPGSRVAWAGPTRFESLLLSVALARLGCEQVPLLPSYGPREREFMLEESRPANLLAWEDDEAGDGPDLHGRLPTNDPSLLPPFEAPSDDPLRWIFYTSGTTSEPKGALHSDGTLLGAAVGLEVPHAFSPDDRVSLLFPFAHIGGPSLLLSALRIGHALILAERFDPALAIPTLSRHGVTLAGSGPAFWQAFIAAQRAEPTRPLFPKLRALIGGGAAKPAHLHDEAREVLRVPIVSGYGSTECPGLAYNHVGDSEAVLATDGRAVEGVEIRIGDGLSEDRPAGQEGEIRVRGPMLFRGYLDEEANDGLFDAQGFFRTGDLGRLDAAGQLRVTGRLKDVIIRKGENISAKEIEDVLGRIDAIADVSVIGLPDPERGERCCAIVVPAEPGAALQLSDLIAACNEAGLMRQKHPEQLELVEQLPRNDTGKVLKAELRARFTNA